ncbi:adenine deaminase C-terminal domain-containing protein [Aureibacillus halotolerans]|uniref:Adenine deaminase n=1 Tax=Aureibacillus halotolerans TaxID=1508390 RepID=A0A4R6U8F5_9BACI|nr:adenine deaminase C-terminal domain-containing protein [Aureibacillus halotolerans]TDQ42838.1 adenine deaminase [Aureibacillus halotolerans]
MHVDVLVTNANVYHSSFKCFEGADVAIKDGRFLYIGQADGRFTADIVLDAEGRSMIPGLVDIHLHIESSMMTPDTFSYGLLKNGVTTVVAEPHEMANVFGIEGITAMIEAQDKCTADLFTAIPSSVPATPRETTGGTIEVEDMEALISSGKVICLGEIMNYVDVIRDPDCKTNQVLDYMRAKHPNLVIEGHCPKLMDLELAQFIFAGADSDHTHQTPEGMEARIKAGMFIELQEKSMTPDVMQYVLDTPALAEHFCFVTDDVMADAFLETGHLNHIVKKAIAMGMRAEDAIYAATYTSARRMNMTDRGSIAPGKIADFSLLDDVNAMAIHSVYKKGAHVFSASSKEKQASKEKQFPSHFYSSVQLSPLSEADFVIKTKKQGTVSCRVMNVNDGSTFTEESHETLTTSNGEICWEESSQGCVAVFERYGKNGQSARGLIQGDTIKRGAIATTYSHDNHNLLVVGQTKADMTIAANEVIAAQGGFCVVENGKVTHFLALPVGGILTELPFEEAAKEVAKLRRAMEALGYEHYNPVMSISTHSLPVSPALKITDHGLIDVNEGIVVPLEV